MEQRLEGMVLRVNPYSDKGSVCRIYTRTHGMRSFFVRRSGKSTAHRLLQPAWIVQFTSQVRENSDIHPIRDVEPGLRYDHIPFDPPKVAVSLFAAELLYRSLPDDYANEQLYDFLREAMGVLDQETRLPVFPVWFVLELSRFYGFYPVNGEGYFDPVAGEFARYSSASSFSEEESRALTSLLDRSYPEVREWKESAPLRRQLLVRLTEYLQSHLGRQQPIRSLDVLHAVFH